MQAKRCLYPGSFDPVTLGHVDIIRRAAVLFDEVVVGVLHNPDKKGFFSPEKRIQMLEKACRGIPNVRFMSFEGLTAQLARNLDIKVLVRGVRGIQDLESESQLARINRQLNPELETIFLPAALDKENISSSMVRQLAFFHAPLEGYVPEQIIPDITDAFASFPN